MPTIETTTAADPIIDFGKHKGHPVSEVPFSYLCWLTDPDSRSFRTRRYIAPSHILDAAWERRRAMEFTVQA